MSNSPNSDRTAIVTGAAGDLGRAIAIRLAQDGYKVAVTDLPSCIDDLNKTAEAVREAGRKTFVVTGDITQENDVQRIVDETVKSLGPLEVMVNNAGKFIGMPFTSYTTEVWDDLLQTNAKATMLCYRIAANQMLKQQKEDKNSKAQYRVIGGCSVAGLTGAPLCAGYAASKFAIRGLTQAAAAELGPFGITVNAYAPGFIGNTKMLGILEDSATKYFNLPEGAWHGAAVNSIKMKRLGEPRHIAAIVSYLASPDAGWTTGQTIAVDGGMHLA